MLKIQGVNQFYGESHILWDLDVEVEKGKCTVLMGRNGVGKTTLMKALSGHLSAGKGEIEWMGKDINGQAPFDRARQGIAYVPQGRDIFSQLTVEENLETAFSALPKSQRKIDPEVFAAFIADSAHR